MLPVVLKIGMTGSTFLGSYSRHLSKSRMICSLSIFCPMNTIFSMRSPYCLKSGNTVYLKDEVILSRERMEQENWYRQALEHKNVVSVGAFDTARQTLTYSRLKKGEFVPYLLPV